MCRFCSMRGVWEAVDDDGGDVRRVLVWVMVVAAAGATAAVFLATRIASAAPLVFVAAAFPQLAFFGVALVSVAVVIAAIRSRLRLATAAGLVVLVVCAGLGIVLTAGRPAPSTTVSASSMAGQLRILSWNTNQQDVSAEQLGALIKTEQANVVALPEYFTAVADGTLAGLAQEHDMQIIGTDSSSATLLISKHFGTYSLADQEATPAWAGFVATSDNPRAPALLVAHLQRPSLVDSSIWQSHADWARQQCAERRNIVAVGDFNATLANLGGDQLGPCRDAAAALGHESTGTWPSALPASLGAAIDHTFVGPGWEPAAFAVLDTQAARGSDHRPIVTVLNPKSS
ncbi:endonuclease/exonuclease/phosphatase family protein [Frigoribacterium sp. CFBP 13707]|uniref:endonuclease/exonuclease/phosphatase family protein n=1 Tax=Frigoribacterium sp. CFBP 13707 TaxID=2775313 RepID=UPI0017856E1F|nr:endonuclease/exonuclease/phosphatase family protein [Frigoribacterium sp. CFBP 13707]MBD8729506.1 endonuclease/exonuclease/phosphatase family protein [Frigoribacterium sp. CFBP 13707]